MFIDGYLLLAIYVISVISLLISIYALWTLQEIKDFYEDKNKASVRYNGIKNKPPIKVERLKGHWD